MKILPIFALLVLFTFSSQYHALAQSVAGQIPPTPFFEGILAGASVEREVVQLYGEGVFLDSLGDLGSRYYTDPKKLLTMVVAFGTDWHVELVQIRLGFHAPPNIGLKAQKKMVSHFFQPGVKYDKIYFGKTTDEIKQINGVPERIYEESGEIIWTFGNTCPHELDSGVSYHFKEDKVVCIDYWADGD